MKVTHDQFVDFIATHDLMEHVDENEYGEIAVLYTDPETKLRVAGRAGSLGDASYYIFMENL